MNTIMALMNIVVRIYLAMQTGACFIGFVFFVIFDSDKVTIKGNLSRLIKQIKSDPVMTVIFIGYYLGAFIACLILPICITPVNIIEWFVVERHASCVEKNNKHYESVYKYFKIIIHGKSKCIINYKGERFSCKLSGTDTEIHNLLLSMKNGIDYIYANDTSTYNQMEYTLDAIFKDLKYTSKNDKNNLANSILTASEIINKALKVAERNSNIVTIERVEDGQVAVNNYRAETNKIYASLDTLWSEASK